jgi:hypothetical protein
MAEIGARNFMTSEAFMTLVAQLLEKLAVATTDV